MTRIVEAELLDELPVDDPRAIHSRRDLRRINALMGNARIMARILKNFHDSRSLKTVVEIGAGDGSFALRLAEGLAPSEHRVEVLLVDRQNLLSYQTAARFQKLGWNAQPIQMDVFDWLAQSSNSKFDLIVANLFLHHFEEARLRSLLEQASKRTLLFLACEPPRSVGALIVTRVLGLIGCNSVTRHDAVISVRAGFRDQELSSLWPKAESWQLLERPAGLFSHCFCARRAVAAAQTSWPR